MTNDIDRAWQQMCLRILFKLFQWFLIENLLSTVDFCTFFVECILQRGMKGKEIAKHFWLFFFAFTHSCLINNIKYHSTICINRCTQKAIAEISGFWGIVMTNRRFYGSRISQKKRLCSCSDLKKSFSHFIEQFPVDSNNFIIS